MQVWVVLPYQTEGTVEEFSIISPRVYVEIFNLYPQTFSSFLETFPTTAPRINLEVFTSPNNHSSNIIDFPINPYQGYLEILGGVTILGGGSIVLALAALALASFPGVDEQPGFQFG